MSRWPLGLTLFATLALGQVTSSFRNGAAGYTGMRDVALVADRGYPSRPDANYEGLEDFADGAPANQATLMRFDVSAIPASATVSAVSLGLEINNATTDNFGLYAVLANWVPSEATWFRASGATAWMTAGATGAADRAASSSGTFTGAVGPASVGFNATGIALVQGWVQGLANRGFILQNYAASSGADFRSCDFVTPGVRPGLTVVTNQGTFVFRNGVSPTATYAGCTDVTIANGPDPETVNWDNNSKFVVDATKTICVQVDLSPIPTWATVVAASFEARVTIASGATFGFYEAVRPWTETGATWQTSNGVTSWQTPGAYGPLDRAPAPVASWAAPALGVQAVGFNDAGVALVQGWVRTPASNLGVLLQHPVTLDSLSFRESEFGTVNDRPRFSVTWVEGAIQIVPSAGTTGQPVATAVRRERLDSALISTGAPALWVAVSAGASGQVSADGGGWASGTTVLIPAGSSSVPIYVLRAATGTAVLSTDAGPGWLSALRSIVFVDAGVDAGTPDAGPADAGPADAGAPDAGEVDGGGVDAGEVDAGEVDAGEVDAGEVDAGEVDAG
ncbi:MAG: hypothetical protein H6Q89_5255, partial [Myxococcaceae bacterium]|nr:hypothetical protein [Myxococcaceae bacterium]